MLENVALMVLLMALGASLTVAMLLGFIYWLEMQND